MVPSVMGKWFLPLFLLVAAISSASAVSLTVENHSFEDDIVASGTYNSSITPTGWTTYDPGNVLANNYNDVGVLNPTAPLYPDGAPDGSNVALIFLWPALAQDQGQLVGLQQTLSATLQTNTKYTLQVEVGNIGDAGDEVAFELAGFPGYAVILAARNSLEDPNSFQILAMDYDSLSPTLAEGTFATSTLEFTSSTIEPLVDMQLMILLINLNSAPGIEVNFDNVRLDAEAVPEPATAVLMIGGLFGALAFNRRRSVRS